MKPLIAIVGATGTGKTELSLDLAERLIGLGLQAEIINSDSMQFYRGMDIGTAKVPFSKRRGIRHHLLDILDVTEESTVASFQTLARNTISEVRAREVVPILVGGSGLYISSVLYDFSFPGTDPQIRKRIEEEITQRGSEWAFNRLSKLDPEAAKSIGPSNTRRIVRALEVIELTGERFGSGIPKQPNQSEKLVQIGLRRPRSELVESLNNRVRQMWQAGLVEEVRGLIPKGLERGKTAKRAIGYEQALDQIHGRSSQEEAIEKAAFLTRRYARRQESWFRRYESIHWLDTENPVETSLALALKDA